MCCIRCVVPDVTPMYCVRCYTDVLCPMLHRCIVSDVVSDVLYPMCCARFTPVCVEGRCPYFDILPLQGAILFKPCSWGEPRV